MATDWTKYGTPVTNNAPTGSTDWSQYGTPVGAAPEVEQGFFGKLSSRYDALQDQTAARAQNAADRWMSGQQSFPSAALTIAGSGAMGALNPFMALLQPAIEKIPQRQQPPSMSFNPIDISMNLLNKIDFSDNKAFQRFAMSDAGENLGTNVEDINALVQFTPVGKGTGMISQTTRGAIDGFQAMTSATIPKLQQKVVDDLANTYREVAGTTVRSNRTLLRSEARGKDPAQFLAERNITPTIEDGKIHTFEQSKALRESADPLNDTLDRALVEIQPSLPLTSIDTLRAKALKGLDELQVTETVREALRREINQEWDLRKARYGERIDLRTVNQLKKTDWKATPFDSNKPYQRDINYINGRASKETIEEAVPLDVVDVRELNSHLGDIYDAAKFLDSLEAKAVKGGRLGKFFARTIGAVVGSQGGVAGSILGGLVGDRAAEILQQSTFGGPLKQLILRQIEKENPAVYKQVQDYLKRSGLERQMRPLLPAPNPNQSTINQGRAIRQGSFSEGEYVGRDTIISSRMPQNPAQFGQSSLIQPNQSALGSQSKLLGDMPGSSSQKLRTGESLDATIPSNLRPSTKAEELNLQIQMYDDLLKDHPAKTLIDRLGPQIYNKQIDEILATGLTNRTRSGKIDTLFDELGYADVQAAQKSFDDYRRFIAKRTELEKSLRNTDPNEPASPPEDTSGSLAFGAAAGVQPDEEGNVAFDPLSAALGFAGLSTVNMLTKRRAALQKVYSEAANETKTVRLQDIAITPELIETVKLVEKGELSKSKLPILLKKNIDGRWEVEDGKHRLVQKWLQGDTEFLYMSDEKLYRKLAEQEAAILEEKQPRDTLGRFSYKKESVLVPKTDMSGGFEGQTLYHAGSKIDEVNLRKSNFDKTFYMTENADYAKSFGGNKSVLNEMKIDPKAKLADMRKPTSELIEQIRAAIAKETSKNVPYGDKNFSFYPYTEKQVLQGIADGKAHFAELPQIKQILRKLGYDGQITAEVPYAKNIGVWNKDVVRPASPSIPKELDWKKLKLKNK